MGFSWTTFVFELVNFIVFLWLLQRMLYRPLQRAISDRREKREQAERHIVELQEQAQLLQEEQAAKRRALEDESEKIIAEARAHAQKERAAILGRADDELADLRRREQEKLARERTEAQLDSARNSLEAGRASAESLLRALAIDEIDEAMLRRLLETIRTERPPEGQAGEQAEVESAATLSDSQLDRLGDAIAGELGKRLSLRARVEPSLIAGLRLRVGDVVYDASLRAQLDQVVARARRDLGIDATLEQTAGAGA
jgi:F-type H+-transporting ATPase subunit b